jgi:hypothetical protein
MHYNRISADCHLDLIWLPPDLFVSEAPRDMKDRMPYVADGPDGRRWVANNGATFGLAGGVGASGTKHIPGKQLRVDKMAETGLYEDGKKGIRRPGDPHLRIKEMDRDGVDAEVIYGILAAAAKLNDREASNEMLRIYNTWLAEFCSHYPDRHIGLACLPYGDIEAAVAEVHRVAKLGFKGIELSCSWDMEPMWHPLWEPLWQAIDEVGIPLPLPHLPVGVAEAARAIHRAHAARADVQQPVPVPDDAGEHPHRADGPGPSSSATRISASASARAASAGFRTCSTAWISSTRTSTRISRSSSSRASTGAASARPRSSTTAWAPS